VPNQKRGKRVKDLSDLLTAVWSATPGTSIYKKARAKMLSALRRTINKEARKTQNKKTP